MFTYHLLWVFWTLFIKGVSSQTVQLNTWDLLGGSNCGDRYFPGDRIIFLAMLTTGVNNTDFPVDNIILKHSKGMAEVTVCKLNIEQDGCNGIQPTACGYCKTHFNGTYYIVFNEIAGEGGQNHTYQCEWIGKTFYIFDKEEVRVSAMPPLRLKVKRAYYWHLYQNGSVKNKEVRYFDKLRLRGWQHDTVRIGTGNRTQHSSKNYIPWSEFGSLRKTTGSDIVTEFQNFCNENLKQKLTFSKRDIRYDDWECKDPVLTGLDKRLIRVTWTCLRHQENQICKCYIAQKRNGEHEESNISFGHSVAVAGGTQSILTCVMDVDSDIILGVEDGFTVFAMLICSRKISIPYTTEPVTIPRTLPVATLADNCRYENSVKKGYIRLGSATTNCTCELRDPGYPPGFVQWFDAQGNEVGPKGTSANLSITSDLTDEGQRYMCKGISDVGREEPGVEFISRFYDKMTMLLQQSEYNLFELCVTQGNRSIFIAEINGYPEPTEFNLKVEEGSEISSVSKEKYQANYLKLNQTFGILTFMYQEVLPSKIFMLNVKNSLNDSLNIRFVRKIEAPGISSTEEQWKIALALVLGVLITMYLVTIIGIIAWQEGPGSNYVTVRNSIAFLIGCFLAVSSVIFICIRSLRESSGTHSDIRYLIIDYVTFISFLICIGAFIFIIRKKEKKRFFVDWWTCFATVLSVLVAKCILGYGWITEVEKTSALPPGPWRISIILAYFVVIIICLAAFIICKKMTVLEAKSKKSEGSTDTREMTAEEQEAELESTEVFWKNLAAIVVFSAIIMNILALICAIVVEIEDSGGAFNPGPTRIVIAIVINLALIIYWIALVYHMIKDAHQRNAEQQRESRDSLITRSGRQSEDEANQTVDL